MFGFNRGCILARVLVCLWCLVFLYCPLDTLYFTASCGLPSSPLVLTDKHGNEVPCLDVFGKEDLFRMGKVYRYKEGIYAFQEVHSQKIYVGESRNIHGRLREHFRGDGQAPALWRDIQVPSSEFRLYILELLPNSTRELREVVEKSYWGRIECEYNIQNNGWQHPNALLSPTGLPAKNYCPVSLITADGRLVKSFVSRSALVRWLGIGARQAPSYIDRDRLLGGVFKVVSFRGGEEMEESEQSLLRDEFTRNWFAQTPIQKATQASADLRSSPVSAYKEGVLVGTYPSLGACGRALGMPHSTVSRAIKANRATRTGFTFFIHESQ
uniref:GIY-YIG endonuclease n=1 Tax=Powellomyces hirtus TaxID=109895 RepID=A0A4P8NPA1_9FUNG|nr:GIY-YIG endonuclease [Powellomyces hirtus]